MKKVGLVGWRGMVGSVLMSRMQEEKDFARIQPTFFTTSQAGEAAPNFGVDAGTLQDAFDLEALAAQDVIITDRKSTRLNSSHLKLSRMPSSA